MGANQRYLLNSVVGDILSLKSLVEGSLKLNLKAMALLFPLGKSNGIRTTCYRSSSC